MPRISTLTLQTARIVGKDDKTIAKFFKKHAADYVTLLDELAAARAVGDDGILMQAMALGLHGLIGSLGEPMLMRAVLAEYFSEHMVPFLREIHKGGEIEALITGLIDDLGKCRIGDNGAPVEH